jgi:hypothetical protein
MSAEAKSEEVLITPAPAPEPFAYLPGRVVIFTQERSLSPHSRRKAAKIVHYCVARGSLMTAGQQQSAGDNSSKPAEGDVEKKSSTRARDEMRLFVSELEPIMEGTFRYLIRHGLLGAFAVHPIYKTLLRLSRFEVSKGAQFKVPILLAVLSSPQDRLLIFLCCKSQVTLEDGRLDFILRERRRSPKVWSLILFRSFPSTLDARLAEITNRSLFHADLERIPRPLIIAVIALASVMSSLAILLSIPWYIGWAIARGLSMTFRSALRTMPTLFGILIVIFITSDAWKMFSIASNWRFAGVLLLMMIIGAVALAFTLKGREADWRCVTGYARSTEETPDEPSEEAAVLASWAADKTPAKDLIRLKIKPIFPPAPPSNSKGKKSFLKLHEGNINILYLITITSHVAAVAFWVSLTFTAMGSIVIDAAMTRDLSGSAADIIIHFQLVGQSFVVTRQLLLISVILGGVAALTFASGTLQEPDSRRAFARYALADLERAIGALAYYYGAVFELLNRLYGAQIIAGIQRISTPEGKADLLGRLTRLTDVVTRLSTRINQSK